jgi:hypothetical protein
VHVIVDLTSPGAGVSLHEPNDCTVFDVVVHGHGDDADVDGVLQAGSVGRMDGGEALVDVDAVRRLASGSVGDTWETDLQAMLEFARSRGWLTDDGAAIRAHIARR